MNKYGMIITGHGEFAVGLYDALVRIAGDQEDCKTVVFDTTKDEKVYYDQLKEAVESFKDSDRLVVFSDLFGGTPFKTAAMLAYEGHDLRVIGGTNLGMLIDFSLSRHHQDDFDALISSCMASGREAIAEFILEPSEDDEEEMED